MPELKHTFMKGRMNKDLDERLVPNGEYRDALNVEVLTSESGDIGSIQNCLGNVELQIDSTHLDQGVTEGIYPRRFGDMPVPGLQEEATCVGSIVDNKTNSAYWLVADTVPKDYAYHSSKPSKHQISRDFIARYNSDLEKEYIILNDIYSVRNDIIYIVPGTTQIEIESTEGLRVGMELRIVWIPPPPPAPFQAWFQTNDKIIITDLNPNNIPPSPGSTAIIEVNQIPLGFAQPGNFVTPFNNQHIQAPNSSIRVNFTAPRVLNFDRKRLITGINIVDDMLFWTDNHTEPKKININRCLLGTSQVVNAYGNFWHEHTDLIVGNASGFFSNRGPIEEKHITNIKRPPLAPPVLDMNYDVERFDNSGNILPTNTQHTYMNWWGTRDGVVTALYTEGVTTDDVAAFPVNTPMMNFPSGSGVDWRIGDVIIGTDDASVAMDSTGNSFVPFSGDDIKVKLIVIDSDSSSINPREVWDNTNWGGNLNFKILAIDEDISDPGPSGSHWYFRLETSAPLYEFKFPRFAYRYKYEDGEYSTFSPFSELAFLPDTFDYHPKEGYNLGMTNYLRTLKVRDFIPKDIPLDVVEVDLLYKESDSPNIYTIKTFNELTLEWNAPGSWQWDRSSPSWVRVNGGHNGSFKVTTDLIHSVVPSNQLLRPWDNVPRRALAQELTANRIIYGNYQQNYDTPIDPKFDVTINTDRHPHEVAIKEPIKSLKSLRTYQVGVVYKDFYGRETPVLSDYASAIPFEKWYANKSNRLHIKVKNPAPVWADSFKYFVKEISNEYYNLAMDRWYDAGDENIWLSFPSEDRNKVDEETTIMLKKGDRRNDFVEEVPKYKILAIENEAPDYIKTIFTSMGYINMKTTGPNTADPHGAFWPSNGGNSGYGPFVGRKNIRIESPIWENSDLASLQNQRNSILEGTFNERGTSLMLRFLNGEPGETNHQATAATIASKWYNISNIAYGGEPGAIDSWYAISIDPEEHDGGFGNDILFLGDDAAPNNAASNIIPDIHVEIAKKTMENKSEFDGRFFVKIHDDISIQSSIKQESPSLSTSSALILDEIVRVNHFRGPSATFHSPHDPALGGVVAGTFPPGAGGAHSIPWDLEAMGSTPTQAMSSIPPIVPPNSFPHPTSGTGHMIDNYIGAAPLYDIGSGGEVQVWEIFWESNPAAAPAVPWVPDFRWIPPSKSNNVWTVNASGGNQATNPIPGPPMEPVLARTHRYPGCELGYDDGTTSATPQSATNLTNVAGGPNSQALMPLPYRTKGEWSTLMQASNNDGWFIDNEPMIYTPSWIVGGSGVYSPPAPGSLGSNSVAQMFSMMKTFGADIGQSTIDISYVYPLPPPGMGSQGMNSAAQSIADRLTPGTVFQFTSDPENIRYEIGHAKEYIAYNYDRMNTNTWEIDNGWLGAGGYYLRSMFRLKLVEPGTTTPKKIGDGSAGVPGKDIYSPVAVHALDYSLSAIAPGATPNQADETSTAGITFFRKHDYHQKTVMPTNPAIFETEPKEDVGLDIYYEISKSYPVVMNDKSNERYIPIDAHLDMYSSAFGSAIQCGLNVCPNIIDVDTNLLNPLFNGNPTTRITLDVDQKLRATDVIKFTTDDGTSVTATVAFDSNYPGPWLRSRAILFDSMVHGENHIEGWNNCYSFGNGVESNRIRDLYNAVTIDKGVKASTTLAEQYKEEQRGSGLIFSGIYNSKMKGVNRLNQFIMAEPITKELNPTYGSIQKLHQRDSDLITLCEDKVLRVLSSKDALYNADGTKNLTATESVLGQAIPYLGDYGISKNPESFASEAFRFYFADKQRGAVLRLSRDGLTPISNYGMKDYFNTSLEFADNIVGSYDTKKSLYNISLFHEWRDFEEGEHGGGEGSEDMLKSALFAYDGDWTVKDYYQTISFREENNGWVSFKSFSPETGFSLNNKYYTTKWGELWEHHAPTVDRGLYYSRLNSSTVNVLLNDSPSSIKSFTTLNYEGSQSRVIANNLGNDGGDSPWTGQYYNSQDLLGWWCNNITTINEANGNQTGTVEEFINKEGKWFNRIRGEKTTWRNNQIDGGIGNVDTQEFSVQGIGNLSGILVETEEERCISPWVAMCWENGECIPCVEQPPLLPL